MVATAGPFSFARYSARIIGSALAMGAKNFTLMYNDTEDFEESGTAGLKGLLIGGLLGWFSYMKSDILLLSSNFSTGSAIGMLFGWLSGIKDEEQKTNWPWMWETK